MPCYDIFQKIVLFMLDMHVSKIVFFIREKIAICIYLNLLYFIRIILVIGICSRRKLNALNARTQHYSNIFKPLRTLIE